MTNCPYILAENQNSFHVLIEREGEGEFIQHHEHNLVCGSYRVFDTFKIGNTMNKFLSVYSNNNCSSNCIKYSWFFSWLQTIERTLFVIAKIVFVASSYYFYSCTVKISLHAFGCWFSLSLKLWWSWRGGGGTWIFILHIATSLWVLTHPSPSHNCIKTS